MNTELGYLQEVLEKSVAKNGEVPLTNKHLLNIINMAFRDMEDDEERVQTFDFSYYW